MQAISLRILELDQQDAVVAAQLDHAIKLLYRKIAMVGTLENQRFA